MNPFYFHFYMLSDVYSMNDLSQSMFSLRSKKDSLHDFDFLDMTATHYKLLAKTWKGYKKQSFA